MRRARPTPPICGWTPTARLRIPRASRSTTCLRCAAKVSLPSPSCLLLYLQKLPGRSVHCNAQLRGRKAGAVDHVPLQFVFFWRPIELEDDGLLRILLRQLVAAMLLRDRNGLIGIRFEEGDVEGLRVCVAGAPVLLRVGTHAGRGSVGRG